MGGGRLHGKEEGGNGTESDDRAADLVHGGSTVAVGEDTGVGGTDGDGSAVGRALEERGQRLGQQRLAERRLLVDCGQPGSAGHRGQGAAGACGAGRTIAHPEVVRERLGGELDVGPLLGVVVDGEAREEVAELGGGAEGVAGRAVHGGVLRARTAGWRAAEGAGGKSGVARTARTRGPRTHARFLCKG